MTEKRPGPAPGVRLKEVSVKREWTVHMTTLEIQQSPKIMHAQEVAQEVLAPQEHTSSGKIVKFFIRKKIKILSSKSRKKLRVLPQATNNCKKFTVVGLISNRQIQNHVYGKHKQQNVILISLLLLLRKDKKHLMYSGQCKQFDFIVKMT